MADITIKIDVSAAVARLQKIQENIPLALKAAAVYVLADAQRVITAGGPGTWPTWKRLPKRPHQLEWLTGTMLRSLTVGDSQNIFQISDDSITVGSNAKYTAAQNFGYPSRGLPARPFFIDSSKRDEGAAQVFKQFLLNGEAA